MLIIVKTERPTTKIVIPVWKIWIKLFRSQNNIPRYPSKGHIKLRRTVTRNLHSNYNILWNWTLLFVVSCLRYLSWGEESKEENSHWAFAAEGRFPSRGRHQATARRLRAKRYKIVQWHFNAGGLIAPLPFFWIHENKCVSNKSTTKVCVSRSWWCPGPWGLGRHTRRCLCISVSLEDTTYKVKLRTLEGRRTS